MCKSPDVGAPGRGASDDDAMTRAGMAVKCASCENTNASNNHNNEVISSLSGRAVLCSGVILARICNYPAT